MDQIVKKLKNLPKFNEYIEIINKKNSPITISGLSDVRKITNSRSNKRAN